MSFVKSLVLPHPHLKKRSVLLQSKAFFGYFIFLLILLYISYQITRSAPPEVLGYADNINVSDLLEFTNARRAEEGVPALKLNSTLSRAAEAKANDMLEKDYWAHESPDGKEPWDFIVASGYDYIYAGENLAVDFNNSDGVVEAWYESPSHKENLLNNKYSEVGFAVVNGELEDRETTLVVQMFGYPRSQPPAIASESTENTEIAVVVEEEPIVEEEVEQEPIPGLEIPIEEVEVSPTTPEPEVNSAGAVLNSSDVFNVSRYIALILGIFVTAMFAVDGYYVRKLGVFRISGHTLLHIIMLIAAIVGIWYTQIGLVL